MRDLGQVVELEAQMIGPGARLVPPVLDDLEVVGLVRLPGSLDRIPGTRNEAFDDGRAHEVQGPMLEGRRDHRPPAARGAGHVEGDLGEALVELAGLLFRPHHVEGVVLENPQAHPVTLRQPAVLAVAAVVDLRRGRRESVPVEGPIDDRGDPPAGDRVLPQLEQACGHVRRHQRP